MSIKHAFIFKFNDFVRCMRISFPVEKDFVKRVATDMMDLGYNLRDLPTVAVAIVVETAHLKNNNEQHQIRQTVEYCARHICGMPAGLDIRKTIIYFAEHTGWLYYKQWAVFKKILDILKRFNFAYHNQITRRYRDTAKVHETLPV